jgi:hypothetical protein
VELEHHTFEVQHDVDHIFLNAIRSRYKDLIGLTAKKKEALWAMKDRQKTYSK